MSVVNVRQYRRVPSRWLKLCFVSKMNFFDFLDSNNFTITQIADIERGGPDNELETRLVYSGGRRVTDVFECRFKWIFTSENYFFLK